MTMSPETTGAAKRISRNSLYMVARTVLIMIITLFTSRITLQLLGVEDFGIYSLVAGFVLMFSLLNVSMERATTRYLVYEKGRGDLKAMTRVFNVAVYAHLTIVALVFLVGETFGLWYVNTHLEIPAGKTAVANVVYQLALITLAVNIMKVPYNASIVAYEKMNFYALLGLGEVVLRLVAILSLYLFADNLLIIYTVQYAGVTAVVWLAYRTYCRHSFTTSFFRGVWDKSIYKKLLAFSGWSILGSAASMISFQGMNVVLNQFFGVNINAAFGLATMVNSAFFGIMCAFQTAYTPHLIGLYARREMATLEPVARSLGKVAFHMGCLMAIPLGFSMTFILRIWLGEPAPPQTTEFCQWVLFCNVVDAICAPALIFNQATGKVRTLNIGWGILMILTIPAGYIAMKAGWPPHTFFGLRTFFSFLVYLFMSFLMAREYKAGTARLFGEYLVSSCIVPVIVLTVALCVVLLITNCFISDKPGVSIESWGGMIEFTLLFWVVYMPLIYLTLSRQERTTMKLFLGKIFRKHTAVTNESSS